MHTFLDCIPCLIRQSLDSVRLATLDEHVHEQLLREVLQIASRLDLGQSPPAMAQRVHRRIRELCHNEDPYRASKSRFNRMALDLLSTFRLALEAASDPWNLAVRLAIAGNVMDLGVKSSLTEAQIQESIKGALAEPINGDTVEFAASVRDAQRVLYLTDNTGEIVFDRLLIEQIPPAKVTVGVRGAPVINDATLEDAAQVGLTQLVEVIDNGSDAPGTLLRDCSEMFQRRFADADLVIAKGQGNYETLREASEKVYFLLRVKCPVIARDIGCSVGTMLLQTSRAAAAGAVGNGSHGATQ